MKVPHRYPLRALWSLQLLLFLPGLVLSFSRTFGVHRSAHGLRDSGVVHSTTQARSRCQNTQSSVDGEPVSVSNDTKPFLAMTLTDIDENDAWDASLYATQPYSMISAQPEWNGFLDELRLQSNASNFDPLWEQVKLEARLTVGPEPEAGPQLYQGILSQPSLLAAISSVISHDIETELIPAVLIKSLFLEMLTLEDERAIHVDVWAATVRSPSMRNAMMAILFDKGLHALVCYRVGHRLWLAGRKGLAYYMQSTVSRKYSADIHPAAEMGAGIFLKTGAGVVIGETAVVGNDVSIKQGVTLGGTGKEAGDRHPKVGKGVILEDGATVLGNIPVGDGAVVTAKSIVTKPVPPLAYVSGVPARVKGYRDLEQTGFDDELEEYLAFTYYEEWRQIGGSLGHQSI